MTYTVWGVYEKESGELVCMFESWTEANFYSKQLGKDEHEVKDMILTATVDKDGNWLYT